EGLGPALTDVPDADAVQQPPDFGGAAPFDLPDEVGCRLGPHAFASCYSLGSQLIQIRVIANESVTHDRVDERLAKPFDVHGPSRREVQQSPSDTGRA